MPPILSINELTVVTSDVVEAARTTLVIGDTGRRSFGLTADLAVGLGDVELLKDALLPPVCPVTA